MVLLQLLYFLPQHVDDHSIIMADQTVIKKGECLTNILGGLFGHGAWKHCKRLSDNAAWGTCAFIALTFRCSKCCQRTENLLRIFIHDFNCQQLPVQWHVRAKVQQRRSLVLVLALIILQGTGCTYLSSIYPSILLVNVLECRVGKN